MQGLICVCVIYSWPSIPAVPTHLRIQPVTDYSTVVFDEKNISV